MKYGLRLDSINARKVRGPDGFFTVVMGIEVFRLIEDKVRELGLTNEVLGDMVLVKGKSWSSISRLLQYARSKGITVIEV